MADEALAASERGWDAAGARSRLFTVRLWKEVFPDGAEYRGSVREVVSGAYANFRDWSDLAAFMVARVEEDDTAPRSDPARHDRP
jgi:hypothetical protein